MTGEKVPLPLPCCSNSMETEEAPQPQRQEEEEAERPKSCSPTAEISGGDNHMETEPEEPVTNN